MKDKKSLSIVGANIKGNREINDFYPTPIYATDSLLKREVFGDNILEPACGDGAISKILEKQGCTVKSQDLIYRGYGFGNIDFLTFKPVEQYDAVITNPPYKYGLEFVKKALSCVKEGGKVAMLLKLVFLESATRYKFFIENPPSRIYVFSKRLKIYKKGIILKNSGLIAYAWFIWEKNNKKLPIVDWINDKEDIKQEKLI